MVWLINKIIRPFRKLIKSVKDCVRRLFYALKARYILPRKRIRVEGCRLKIEVITMMYNEAILAPLFVRHYAPWVDKMTVFYSHSIDGTRRELEVAAAECGFESLTIIPVEFPNGFDDILKINHINGAVRNSSADYVVCVDADEFVYPWPFDSADPRKELEKEVENIVRCSMFHVYRNLADADIDTKKPPLFQRRHGSVDVDRKGRLKWFDKPCIVRPDSGVQFLAGCHSVTMPYPENRTTWRGVHWGKADNYCKVRYVRDRRDRLSKSNLQRNYGIENFNITEERLRAELKAHENDPQLF